MKAVLALMLLFSTALADEEFYNSLNHTSYEPNYFGMLFGLIVVIALIYVTAILYKKMTKIKLDNTSSDSKYDIRVISSASLGQNKNLYVIKTGLTYSLIGATNDKITHIKELGSDDEN